MEQYSNGFKEQIVFAENGKSFTIKNKRDHSPLLSVASGENTSEISFETHSQILEKWPRKSAASPIAECLHQLDGSIKIHVPSSRSPCREGSVVRGLSLAEVQRG